MIRLAIILLSSFSLFLAKLDAQPWIAKEAIYTPVYGDIELKADMNFNAPTVAKIPVDALLIILKSDTYAHKKSTRKGISGYWYGVYYGNKFGYVFSEDVEPYYIESFDLLDEYEIMDLLYHYCLTARPTLLKDKPSAQGKTLLHVPEDAQVYSFVKYNILDPNLRINGFVRVQYRNTIGYIDEYDLIDALLYFKLNDDRIFSLDLDFDLDEE